MNKPLIDLVHNGELDSITHDYFLREMNLFSPGVRERFVRDWQINFYAGLKAHAFNETEIMYFSHLLLTLLKGAPLSEATLHPSLMPFVVRWTADSVKTISKKPA